MNNERERVSKKSETVERAETMTAIGVVPAEWIEEEARRAITKLAMAEGHTGPLELVTLRDASINDPVLIEVCDFPALLRFVTSKRRRIADPVEAKYEH